MRAARTARNETSVILSEAKDLLAGIERREMILRFAQDDKPVRTFRMARFIKRQRDLEN